VIFLFIILYHYIHFQIEGLSFRLIRFHQKLPIPNSILIHLANLFFWVILRIRGIPNRRHFSDISAKRIITMTPWPKCRRSNTDKIMISLFLNPPHIRLYPVNTIHQFQDCPSTLTKIGFPTIRMNEWMNKCINHRRQISKRAVAIIITFVEHRRVEEDKRQKLIHVYSTSFVHVCAVQ